MNDTFKNMKTDEARLRELLDRFFEARTSTAEERELYALFSSPNLPADLASMRPLLGWFAEGMPAAPATPAVKSVAPRRTLFAFVASIAAMIAIIITLGVDYSASAADHYAMYEGSFVMRNGQRITDLRQIMPQLRAVEADAEQVLTQKFSSAEIPDGALTPEARAAYDDILNY